MLQKVNSILQKRIKITFLLTAFLFQRNLKIWLIAIIVFMKLSFTSKGFLKILMSVHVISKSLKNSFFTLSHSCGCCHGEIMSKCLKLLAETTVKI